MRESLRMALVLTVFALAAGALLAWTNAVTRAPIARARRAETLDALKRVMPPCENDLEADARAIDDGGRSWTFYVGRGADGAFSGAAFEAEAEGYGGAIRVLAGLRADGTVNRVEVLLADRETPGLGAKIGSDTFIGQFTGRSAGNAGWAAVTRDGGAIQGITGATISSRAVCKAVRAGLEVFARHADGIRAAAKEPFSP